MREVVKDEQPTDDRGATDATSAPHDPGERPRLVSAAKLEANRRNAQRSTGPRTPEGKAKARWNAVTHGVLAKAVVVDIGVIREDKAEFQRLLASSVEDLQPLGMLEHICVERIAVALWRLRRALRAEAGRLSQDQETAEREAWSDYVGDDEERLAPLIRQMQEDLANGNAPSDTTLAQLKALNLGSVEALEKWAGQVCAWAAASSEATAPAEKQAAVGAWTHAVEALREELQSHQATLDEAYRWGRATVKITRVASAIPGPEAVAHLGRYETMHRRELDRAIRQLRELRQQRRKEEARPAARVEGQTDPGR